MTLVKTTQLLWSLIITIHNSLRISDLQLESDHIQFDIAPRSNGAE